MTSHAPSSGTTVGSGSLVRSSTLTYVGNASSSSSSLCQSIDPGDDGGAWVECVERCRISACCARFGNRTTRKGRRASAHVDTAADVREARKVEATCRHGTQCGGTGCRAVAQQLAPTHIGRVGDGVGFSRGCHDLQECPLNIRVPRMHTTVRVVIIVL